MRKFFLLFVLLLVFVVLTPNVLGDELDDINKQLATLNQDLENSLKATKPLESDLNKLKLQLDGIVTKVNTLEKEIITKEKELKKGEEVLTYQKEILDQRTFEYYKNAKKVQFSFINLLVADNLSDSLQSFFYQKTLADQDKQTIIKIILYINNLEERKKSLESEKIRLAQLKVEIDKQSSFLSGEINKAKVYQSELSSKIASLTTRQQQILDQKLAGLGIPRSAGVALGGCVDDRGKDPGFSPAFAFFTFGVPNRVGLNQFGAKGRAESGQDTETILRAYYDNFELKKDYDTGININVDGKGSYNIEDYLKHLGEMPESWHMEALKAQVVAARSYALAYTGNGSRSICSTDSCQVFLDSEKGDRWKQAVNDTKGWVMVQGGSPIKAWFSSTHGGIILKSSEVGWSDTSWTKHGTDTKEGTSSISDLRDSDKAYDKASPWFYCDWGSRSEYNKTAWLKSDEIADIANILLLAKNDSSTISHLAQTDKSNPDGVETWDKEKVKNELKSRGINPYSSISNISISADTGAGKTNTVVIEGDAGSKSFDGSEFKNFFNLRAPANIQIVGPLYNVEKK